MKEYDPMRWRSIPSGSKISKEEFDEYFDWTLRRMERTHEERILSCLEEHSFVSESGLLGWLHIKDNPKSRNLLEGKLRNLIEKGLVAKEEKTGNAFYKITEDGKKYLASAKRASA